MKNSDSWRMFLQELFLRLDRVRINYCLLSFNHENPYAVETDLDLVVKKEHLNKFDNILQSTIEDQGLLLMMRLHHGRGSYAYRLVKATDGFAPSHLTIDVCTALSFRFFGDIINGSTLLKHRQKMKEGVWILSPTMEAVYIIIKRLMKLKFYQKHIEKINKLLIKDIEEIRNLFKNCFGKIGKKILDYVLNKRYVNTKELAGLRNRIVSYTFYNNPMDKLAFQISEIKRIIERLRAPQGCCILLVGYNEEINKRLTEQISGELSTKGDHGYALPWAAATVPQYSLLQLLSLTSEQFYKVKKTLQLLKLMQKVAFVRIRKELLILQIACDRTIAPAFNTRNPIFRFIDIVFIINDNIATVPTYHFPKKYVIESAQDERTIVINICNNIVRHISARRRFRGDFKPLHVS